MKMKKNRSSDLGYDLIRLLLLIIAVFGIVVISGILGVITMIVGSIGHGDAAYFALGAVPTFCVFVGYTLRAMQYYPNG